MKAILEFNLPDDEVDYKLAVNAASFYSAVWEYDQFLRSQLKHVEMSDEKHAAFQEARDKLRDYLMENDVSLN